MLDKKKVLDKINKIEDKLLVSKILDKAVQAEKSWIFTFSDFLDPYQCKIIERMLHSIKDIEYRFDGGYEGAERRIVIFRPLHMQDKNIESSLRLLHIIPKIDENLSHRDYLGSLMGLGIKREKIGDIIINNGKCSVVVIADIADYILYNLNKIGRINVDVKLGELADLAISEPEAKEIKCTVPSLRLDCIVSSGFGISRSQIAPYFKSSRIHLNWEIKDSLSAQVREGDVISVKGKGRVILEKVGNTTKKARISIILKRLI